MSTLNFDTNTLQNLSDSELKEFCEECIDFRDPSIVQTFVQKHNLQDHSTTLTNMPDVLLTTDDIQKRQAEM